MSQSDWTMCLNFAKLSRFNSHHLWGTYVIVKTKENHHFDNEIESHMNPEHYKGNSYSLDLILLNIWYYSCV